MEIERKYLVNEIPFCPEDYPSHFIEQGYLNVQPVLRVRREDENFYLTYKGKGLLMREEYNLPLTKEAYLHLLSKADGLIITKRRYLIPYLNYTIELDVFLDALAPLVMAEVEFSSEQEALDFVPPAWFGKDVTMDGSYQNSSLSQKSPAPVK